MRKYIEVTFDASMNRDFVIDNIEYHAEFDPLNEKLYLYIPQNVIICPGSRIGKLYPEIKFMELGLLYPEILRFMNSDRAFRSRSKDESNRRFLPEPLSITDYVYYIAYEKDTDNLYLALPAKEYRTDFLTIDVVYPELKYMHQGLLMEIIKSYFH